MSSSTKSKAIVDSPEELGKGARHINLEIKKFEQFKIFLMLTAKSLPFY